MWVGIFYLGLRDENNKTEKEKICCPPTQHNYRYFYTTPHERIKQSIVIMFRKLRDMYRQYKPYVRVDLIMYASLILMIILYFIISTVFY